MVEPEIILQVHDLPFPWAFQRFHSGSTYVGRVDIAQQILGAWVSDKRGNRFIGGRTDNLILNL